jgi:hypothetical protein
MKDLRAACLMVALWLAFPRPLFLPFRQRTDDVVGSYNRLPRQ